MLRYEDPAGFETLAGASNREQAVDRYDPFKMP